MRGGGGRGNPLFKKWEQGYIGSVDKEILIFEGHRVEVRRKAFQRRLGVTIHPSGAIRVSANRTLSQRQIIKFLASHRDWVDTSLAESAKLRDKYPPKRFASGEVFPFLGTEYRLRIIAGAPLNLSFHDQEIHFRSPVAEADFSPNERRKYYQSFKKSYRQVAEKVMSDRLKYFSQKMQLFPTGVQFRGQKSIWGSCSANNKISLNFKLIVAPIQVVDYVLIHELAHIRHKNHSSHFWHLVEQYTDHRHRAKEWLRDHQHSCDFLNKKSELFPGS